MRSLRTLRRFAFGFALGLIASASLALDLERQVSFSIPAQSLDAALVEFSRQAQLQIVTAGASVREQRSAAVTGTLSIADALERLLGTSGLTYKPIGESAISIGRSKSASGPAAARSRLARLDSSPVAPAAPGADAMRTPGRDTTPASVSLVEEVIVTGTNIAGVAPAGAPVIVIDSEAIRQSGYSSTEQLLQSLPQNFRGGEAGASADVNFSSGSLFRLNHSAGSGVNLRGLGSAATLVLVNGRRLAASNAGTFTDISLIPIDAIERIEILTDGASAIYGADAVAGVVNVILKQNHDSAETRARYAFTTENGREEYRLSQNVGMGWDGGGATLSLDFLDQGQMLSRQRAFTAGAPDPNSIFPANELASVILAGEQRFGEHLSAHSDVQYSRSERHLISSSGFGRSDSFAEPERLNALLSLAYEGPGDWRITLDGMYSEEDTPLRLVSTNPRTGARNYSYLQTQWLDQWSGELRASGSLFEVPGGLVKLALGGSYREEEYYRHIDLYNSTQRIGRDVRSGYLELHVPLVGAANAVRGVRRLELSLAGRYDDYSDFGSSSNPRVGLSWKPIDSLTVRSSYSTSFRAPATGRELVQSERGVTTIDLVPFFTADGTGTVPVAILAGSDELGPEESTNWTVGFTWRPLTALEIGFTYYDISYTDRIIVPPFDLGALASPQLRSFFDFFASPAEALAAINRYVAQGALLGDYTDGEFGPDPLSQIDTFYRYLWTNAERVDVSGADLTLAYVFERGANRFDLGFNANYVVEMVNVPAPGAPSYDLVDTFGNPPDVRLRTSGSWSRGGFSGTVIVNYTGAYTDTSGLIDRGVEAYTTVDASARYRFERATSALLEGLSLSLTVTNLFDEEPPFIETAGSGAHYDPANASPLGRMIGLEVAKRW